LWKIRIRQPYLRVLRFSPVNIIPPWFSKLKYHLEDKEARLGLQFRDIFLPHRHEQHEQNVGLLAQMCARGEKTKKKIFVLRRKVRITVEGPA
jgi:hypothetical protein